MKTSNKLIITAVLVILVGMAVYDRQLKAAYFNGDYRGNTKNYVPLDFKGFDVIQLNASTAINILIRQGPFSVKVDPDCQHFVKLIQKGNTLQINAVFSSNFESNMSPYILVITCPKLTGIITDAKYMAGPRPITDLLASEDFKWRPTLVQGFTGDSLYIHETHASNLVISGSHITNIQAFIGADIGSRSNLKLENDNDLKHVSLITRNKSQVWLNGIVIPGLSYTAADSVKLILTGSSQKIINNPPN